MGRDLVALRDVIESDIPIFYEHQRDADANRMAAFAARDREAFDAHWKKIMADPALEKKTILLDGEVAGNIVAFDLAGEHLVGYWIGKEYWGRGAATGALQQFVVLHAVRPLHARVAKHNVASIRVLEKCGFVVTGSDVAAADARWDAVEELIMTLGS